MNRENAASLVRATIRERAFDGEGADVPEMPLEATLAEIGFDSLSFVSVVSGLEAALGRSFPSEYWEQRRMLRVADLVDAVELLARTNGSATATFPRFEPHPPRHAADRRGAILSVLRASAGVFMRNTFSSIDAVILERELENLPSLPAPAGVSLRRATAADQSAFSELWPRERRGRMVRQFRARLASGYTCLAAFEGGEVVAIDWLNEADPEGAVAAVPGTCLGISLHERSDQGDRGIGLALLAYSLEVCREAGYVRQAAYVSAKNLRMRTACTSLLGFREAGSARRTTKFGRMRWRWQIGATRGEGPVLEI
jgi:acyl carrier protein/L-amino acid N-acyltransferase YncA